MVDIELNDDSFIAEHVVGRRIVTKTVQNYKSKLNTLRTYLFTKSDYNLYLTDNGDFILPFCTSIIKECLVGLV
jgi:hypothetical protein